MREEARRCVECRGSVSTRILPHYKDLQIGVLVDLVDAVEEITCKKCGERRISFPDFNGLVATIAIARIKTPIELKGEEIRFLRKALELTAKELAGRLSVTSETISRWENNKEPVGPPTEKLLRISVMTALAEHAPGITVSEVDILNMPKFRLRERHVQMGITLQYGKLAHTGKNQIAHASRKEECWREVLKHAA